ncbi:MAG: hypothetical protein CSB49_07565 [Proteobacteria bacterium]|nr:MAG: hypothetical protein CSB49_07565 [Pseudomonadota bacterium]
MAVEPDSQAIALESHEGPQHTAALDRDDGRLLPYVDSKQGTVETSPGGSCGLRSPSSSGDKPKRGDRRAVGGARDLSPAELSPAELSPAELHQQLTSEARIARRAARRAVRERTSWVTLMLGDPGRQRWMRGAIVTGIVVLALAGGFLFRYLRIGHAVGRKRTDAASLLRRGNLGDYVQAAQKFDDIVRSQRDKTRAWLSRVCINAAIPFEFGDPDPRPIGNADSVTGVDTPEKAAIEIYRKLAQGDLERAATVANQLRVRYPKGARVHYLSGRILLLQGSSEAAATRLERAIALDEGHALYHRSLGDALAARGRAEKAETEYARALKINPNHVATHVSRAKLLLARRELDDAERLLRELVSGKYKRFAARGQLGWGYALQARLAAARGEVELVRELVERARSHAPEEDATFYDTLADVSIAAFALGDAERYAQRSEELMRGRPHPGLAKARIYLRQGRVQAASRALPKRPRAAVSSLLLARIMLRMRRLADARRYAKRALSGAPESVEANLVMAKVLAAEGRLIDAQDKLSGLLAHRDRDARVLTALGEVLLKRKRVDDAQRRFEQAIRADNTALEAKLRLADVLLVQGKFHEAHATLFEAHKRHSWYVPILRRLAELDLGQRKLGEARKNFDLVLGLVKKDARAQLGIVKVLTLQLRFEQATKLLGQVRGATPGALELAEGRLALAKGEGESAAGKLKKATVPLAQEPEPWLLLVRVRVFNNELGEAESLAREMERRFGKRHPAPWEARGLVAYGRGKLRPAVAAYRKALESAEGALLMPIDLARLNVKLGRIIQDQGNTEEALTYYRRAKQLCPSCPEPVLNEGLALDELGKKDAALAALSVAKRLAPRMQRVYLELAKIYAAVDKRSLAIKMYEMYVSLDPPAELKQQARTEIENLKAK